MTAPSGSTPKKRRHDAMHHPLPEDHLRSDFRHKMYVVIFGTETRPGRVFDVALLIAIVSSIVVVMLDSVVVLSMEYGRALIVAEWTFTILFTIEYVLRLYCVPERARYARSFFGVVDLLSILPTYASLVVGGLQSLLVIRVLRLLRVFRVLKIVRMLGEANTLLQALRASVPKIAVFLGAVLSVVIIIGTAMHLIEGAEHGFSSIPRSMYWAIVTLTTVGYGDIAPQTVPGQALAAMLMILGYGIIAVPTGIVSAELVQVGKPDQRRHCRSCGATGHLEDANFCRVCGGELV